jgi:hypothetical protein
MHRYIPSSIAKMERIFQDWRENSGNINLEKYGTNEALAGIGF